MGITRFGTRMKAYAERTILGSTESPAKDAVAVIDGPGLAHFIYYQLCDDRSSGLISYKDVAKAVITWLETLQAIGYRIEAILFDGALPVSKKDVRIGRLQGYITKVQTYKQNIGSGLPSLSPAARRSLPPPPFLVFSIVEELLATASFADITYVVPGEADPFCIAAAQGLRASDSQETITIFSDDADLLVYELDAQTCVTPFRDMESTDAEANITWSGDLYWSEKIAQRGPNKRKDLIEPAYFMSLDPHCTLDKALRMTVPKDNTSRKAFAQFAEMFKTATEVATWAEMKADLAQKEAWAMRDSRVSELIHQCSNDPDSGVRMYLPYLFDDISRATAWSVGTDVRQLAYSLATKNVGIDADVQEYRRSGTRIVSTLVEAQNASDIDQRLNELNTYLTNVQSWARDDAGLFVVDTWRYIVMQQTLQYLNIEGYDLPSIDDILPVISNQEMRKWHLIHLSAQYQATFYSLRILYQVLEHVVRHQTKLNTTLLNKLADQMFGLPKISELFGTSEQDWRELLTELLATFDDQEERHDNKRRKKSKKRKKGDAEEGSLARNPFAMLADSG